MQLGNKIVHILDDMRKTAEEILGLEEVKAEQTLEARLLMVGIHASLG